ncbi:hypothetical protein EHS19_04535 [Bifidobacterium jacchi]|uniref:Uncharacterized protein n=1 Tax=Bifidobacterium jacchi TaxID=2490545 RepID=A0A5N5RKZ1_9BIFI|nr:hypothetical protein EHS19_04535 [Bifidobacterium jacchi]
MREALFGGRVAADCGCWLCSGVLVADWQPFVYGLRVVDGRNSGDSMLMIGCRLATNALLVITDR